MSEPKDPSEELQPVEDTPTPEVSASEPEKPKEKPSAAMQALEAHVQKSKMQRKATVRAGISIGAILALVAIAWKVVPSIVNTDPGTINSGNFIVALKETGGDRRAVMLGLNGEETESPDFVAGSTDQAPVWSGDGQRIYFISDRDSREPHVFRWNPKPGKFLGFISRRQVERRTIDSRAKSQLTFNVPGSESKTGLLIAGGTVLEFDPSDGKTMQVLPPSQLKSGAGAAGDEGSRSGQFDAGYVPGATGFLTARWLPGKGYIAATLRMEDGGEMMIQQNVMEPGQRPQIFPLAGDHLDFDIDPISGNVLIAIQNARWVSPEAVPRELVKDGKAPPPFKHGLVILGASGMQTVIASQNDNNCWSKPRVSPGGLEKVGFLAITGSYNVQTKSQMASALLLLGPAAGNQERTKGMAAGNVTGGEWHPGGQKIVFTMYIPQNKRRSVCTMNIDGSEQKVLTKGDADYSNATFSPLLQ